MPEKKNNLEEFLEWVNDTKPKLERLGFTSEFFDVPDELNSCMRIVFRSNSVTAVFCAWDYGDPYAEAIYLP